MPKPRSSLPSKVTLVALALLVIIAILQSLHRQFILEKFLIWILVALVVIPIIFTLVILRKEKLNIILGKLDTDNRLILENIIGILQNIYFNEKTMVQTLSANVSEDKVIELYSEIVKMAHLSILNYIQAHDGNINRSEKLKIRLYAIRDIIAFVIRIVLSPLYPYFIREMRFLKVAAIPDALGIGLNSIEDTDKDLNKKLKAQLWDATKIIRTNKSVNAIQKCLRYSHATSNLYLTKLLGAKRIFTSSNLQLSEAEKIIPLNKLRLDVALTRGDPDHLMSQRFAEVANVVSKELME